MNVVKKLFDIRAHELPRFSLLFLAFFIYNVGVSWSNSSVSAIILNELGAEFVAQGLIFYGITTIIASVIYTAFVDRIAKHRLLVIMTAISAFSVGIVFVALILGARAFAAVGLFVLSEAILLIWVLQWQTALLDMYDTRSSKRILPMLGVGRLVGISFGGFSYPFLTGVLQLSADQIVFMWCLTLVAVLVIVWAIPRLMKDPPPEKPRGKDEGFVKSLTDGFLFIRQSRYLQWLAISAILMNAMISLFQYRAGVLVEDYYRLTIADSALREAAIGNFFATIDAYGTLAMLFVQVIIFPALMNRFGVGGVNLIYPIASFFVAFGLSAGSLGLVGSSFFLLIAGTTDVNRKAFRRVFRSSINSLLVNAVSPFMKGRSRSVINGIIAPFAVIFIGFISQIESEIVFTVAVLAVSGGYVLSAFAIKRYYTQSMLELLESNDYASLLSLDLDLGEADKQMLTLLATRLRESNDPEFKRFIATIMAEVGGQNAEPILMDILGSLPDADKADYLRIMLDAEAITEASRTKVVAYSTSDDIHLKRVAIKVLVAIIPPQAPAFSQITAQYLHDADYIIRLTAATALARYGDNNQQERAHRVIRASLNDYDTHVRQRAIRSLVELGDPRHIEQLVILLDDDDDSIRLQATLAIDALWDDTMPEAVKKLVYAREKLFLDDPILSVREAEFAILKHFKGSQAHRALLRGLTDESLTIRRASVDALAAMGRAVVAPLQAALRDASPMEEKMMMVTLARIEKNRHRDKILGMAQSDILEIYHHHDNLNVLGFAADKPSYIILSAYYDERNKSLLEEVFWMLAYAYGKQINVIRETVASDNSRTRINAIEALESVTSPDFARLISPLFDPKSTTPSLSALYRDRTHTTRQPEALIEELMASDNAWLRVIAVSLVGDLGTGNTEFIEMIHGQDATIPRREIRDSAQNTIPTLFLRQIIQKGLADAHQDVVTASRSAMRQITGRSVVQDYVKEGGIVLATVERMIYLKQSAFFRTLTVERLKALANICEEEFIKQEGVLFQQGDPGGALYIVVSGAIRISLTDGKGERIKLASYGATRAFGDMSLFDNSTRSADAIAEEDTLMLKLSREPFLALARQYPDLSVHLITELSERLRQSNRQIAELNSSVRHNPVL